MLLRLLSQLARLLSKEHNLRHNLRRRNPTLQVSGSVELILEGEICFSHDVIVSDRAKLIVPKTTCLNLGDKVYVGRDVELGSGNLLSVGQRVSLQDRCVIVGDVDIGGYSLLSFNVLISSGIHYFRRHPHLLIRDQDSEALSTEQGRSMHSQPVRIGEDCWLGVNTVVMPGVSIGRGAVIGANSVVTEDIEPYSVVAGAPAKPIGRRLDFCPPNRIKWDDPLHTPYFYAGFDLAVDQRAVQRRHGGLVARQSFEVWLENFGTTLFLRVRSVGPVASRLSRGDVNWDISSSAWTDIQVARRPGAARFELSGCGVAVAEAWTA
jgi:acetyltransferase-like isoleucine patch superfamily enzyme